MSELLLLSQHPLSPYTCSCMIISSDTILGTTSGHLLSFSPSKPLVSFKTSLPSISCLCTASQTSFYAGGSEIHYYTLSFELLKTIQNPSNTILHLSSSPSFLISSSSSRSLSIYPKPSYESKNLYTHSGEVLAFSYEPVKNIISSSCSLGTLVVFSIDEGVRVAGRVVKEKVTCIEILMNNTLVTGNQSGTIHLYGLRKLDEIFQIKLHCDSVIDLGVSLDQGSLVSLAQDGVTFVLDLSRFEVKGFAKKQKNLLVKFVDKDRISAVSNEGSLSVWGYREDEKEKEGKMKIRASIGYGVLVLILAVLIGKFFGLFII